VTTSQQSEASSLDAPGPVSAARWSRGWLMALLPAGFVLGLLGGFLQEHRWEVGAVEVPWAWLLVVAALVASIRAASLNLATRMAGWLGYVGWLSATVLLALPNPSGDVVFAEDPWSLWYLLTGSLLGAATAAWPLFLDAPAGKDAPAEPAGGAATGGTDG
jgi:hypothetical protein